MTFGAAGSRPSVDARLEEIGDRTAPRADVDAKVRDWMKTGFDAFARDGFVPDRVVATTTDPLDGRESTVRNRPGPLTDLITAAIAREVKGADLAILNGGSIRIDDVLPPGPIREYDIIRVLPFGGKILKATFDGSLLASVLHTGETNAGTGGYLQTWGVTKSDHGILLIQGKPIDSSSRYTVAITDFLLTGLETNLAFLTRTNPHVHDVTELRDIRQAVIDEFKARYPGK
jgi:5'-nucleotidase